MMMKRIIFFWFFIGQLSAQTIPFQWSVSLKPLQISGLPGLHSFVAAQSGSKWLFIGGRKDGLHPRQPFSSFAASSNNTDILVVDVSMGKFWSSSVNSLPAAMAEQLQSTNLNFMQRGDTLYIIGGYGYSNTQANHITHPGLITVQVSSLINAVVNAQPIQTYFKQLISQDMAVTGAYLGYLQDTFYLVGGHRFDGRYNPMGNPTYTQTYVSGYKKFTIQNSASVPVLSAITTVTDQVHLHRRDYNLLPQIYPDGERGYTIFSGVFQTGVNLPFLYSVDIKSNGYFPQTQFNQYLSNYHSAKVAMYDSSSQTMHSMFFGGMSRYYYVNNVLTQDDMVPFVKTISRVSRNASGNLEEVALKTEMPELLGAGAEFLINRNIPHDEYEILELGGLKGDSTLIGYIYGGIYSPQLNPFSVNNTGVTSANNVIYEVWLAKDGTSGLNHPKGNNPMRVNVSPNPANGPIKASLHLPYAGTLKVMVTDVHGKLVYTENKGKLSEGMSEIQLETNLLPGYYTFNFIFDGIFSNQQKVIIKE